MNVFRWELGLAILCASIQVLDFNRLRAFAQCESLHLVLLVTLGWMS